MRAATMNNMHEKAPGEEKRPAWAGGDSPRIDSWYEASDGHLEAITREGRWRVRYDDSRFFEQDRWTAVRVP